MSTKCRPLALFLFIGLIGCGGGPELAPVEGTVSYEGKPIVRGTITFEAKDLRPAVAQIENGKIVRATTVTEGDGVPVGSHLVAISATDVGASAEVADPGQLKAPMANYMGAKQLIPTKYGNPATSGLKAEIQRGTNHLKFELTQK